MGKYILFALSICLSSCTVSRWPAYQFCKELQASGPRERRHLCAEQNDVGLAAFWCQPYPIADDAGGITYAYVMQYPTERVNLCTVQP
jgi:hypothetical protein